ncbi:asparagine synthase-related protein [Sphingomonas pruni]|uniref:asparagine synthase-related protein n=1 Tax=Sphingomonas pruni TaxID=40683 RepID=UPI0009FE7F96|nr:asparagine synthase-related protein [Sphingomonas pruni]
MSAICGVVRFDAADVSPRCVDRMARAMRHRGAHGIETVELGRLALGHCLMRVNREDVHEAQPIVAPDAVLVADLRLDNREELAATLGIADTELATLPDSEVLLAAWRRWGANCAQYLLGDFAFAIWNRGDGTLLLGRDHMGQRVIHYYLGDGFLAFATELCGLFAADDIPQRLNEDELARRLLMSTERVEGEQIYADIHLLPGGTTLRLAADGKAGIDRYWQPHAATEHLCRDDAYYLDAYRKTIQEAVACRLRRLIDPPSLLFSGGFDSGTIAALAGPMVLARGWKLTCIASVLPEDASRRDARPAVEAFRGLPGLDLHFYVRGNETSYDDLETVFARTFLFRPPSVVRRRIGDMARRAGSRLIMDGHGGDYTVNAYDQGMLGAILRRGEIGRFAREFRARQRFTGWSPVRVVGRDLVVAIVPQAIRILWRTALNGFVPAWKRRGVQRDFALGAIASGVVDRRKLRDGFRPGLRWRARWLEVCRRVSAGGAGGALATTEHLDLTRPFHDKRIVELGCALPDRLVFRDGRERWLARTAFADILPQALICRPPGNDREQPDLIAMDIQAAPAMLAALEAVQHDSSVARYVDVPALAAMVRAGCSEDSSRDRIRLSFAMNVLTAARFLAWFDRNNR